MAREITVRCDMPGCSETTIQDTRAGALLGWMRREIKDSVKLELQIGVQEFSARHDAQYFCPEHVGAASEIESPPTHPEVLEFIEQKERDDHGRNQTL